MSVLIINEEEVRNILSMKDCICAMSETFKALAKGDSIQPLRSAMPLPNIKGLLGMMPAYIKNNNVMGIKVISVFPENFRKGLSSHQGAVLLFEGTNGQLISILNADAITAIRTAAVSAVATDALARENCEELAILGAGVQARMHLKSMLLVRAIKRVKVWDLYNEYAEEFVRQESQKHGISMIAAETVKTAVEHADIICTVTAAREPILRAEWVQQGTHINAVGAVTPTARELESALVARSKLYTDSRASLFNESGDFLIPKREGLIGEDHVYGELGEILVGKINGRQTAKEITLFKSLGLAVEDLAASLYVYEKAMNNKIGKYVTL